MKKNIVSILFLFTVLFTQISAGTTKVYLGGDTVAIQGNYNGVLVSGMYDFELDNTWINTKNESELKVGDRIISIEDYAIQDLDSLYHYLSKYPKRNAEYKVTILRDKITMIKKLKVYYSEDEKLFKTVLYVKDKIKGIGTITFFNPTNNSYAALGHEIMENDLGRIAEISAGDLLQATVSSITRSSSNSPGEKNCISTGIKIGNIIKNTQYGLYGFYTMLPSNRQLVEIGLQEIVHKGYAVMYTVIDSNKVIPVNIMITSLNYQPNQSIKGIQFEIVDEEILKKTGGIIQGMSGSPIMQDGRLIGAVTHMITSSPTKGYGIYIEWMLMESDNLK